MRCLWEFIQWKKVLVRAVHLFLVFIVMASLLFQPSGKIFLMRNKNKDLYLDLRTALYDGSNYFYCIAYGLLVYLSIFFYFLTCYTDPGYVPYKRVQLNIEFIVKLCFI
jgi:hypothetical protein